MKKIYTSENKVMIYLLKSKLEEKNIQCLIKNENPPIAGEIPPILAWPELWVMQDEQYDHALKLVQNEIEHSSEKKERWKCQNCGELLAGQFDLCWKCGSGRQG